MTDNFTTLDELQTFINAIDSGITIIDGTEEIILFNTKMVRMTGYTLAEAKRIEGLLYLLLPHAAKTPPTTLTQRGQLRLSKATQTIFMESQNIALVPTKSGTPQSMTVVCSTLNFQGQTFRVNTYHEVTPAKQEKKDFTHLLESVVIHANDAILITEAEPFSEPGPKIVYANAAFTRMTGYRNDEILGQTPRILQGEKTSSIQKAKIRQALEHWEPVREELINYKKDGTEFWVELNIVPVANSTGWFTHWISIQRDITTQKALETALRDSQQQCKLAVSSGKMGLWDWDIQTQIIHLEPSLQDMMGLESSEGGALVQGWSQIVHPDDLEQVLAAIEAHLSHITPTLDIEYRMRHYKGQHLWVSTRGQAFWNDQGEAYRLLGLNADITDRKQVAISLFKSEQRFRKIFTEAPIGILQSQFQGKLIQVNQAFCQMLGYSAQQLLTLSLQNITHPEDLKAEISHTQQILNGDISIYQLEKRYIKQDGSILWTQVTRGKIQMPEDSTPIIIDMVQDETDRHQIEQMKDDFISVVTHELRTPLTSLKGALSLLSTGKLGNLNEQGQ